MASARTSCASVAGKARETSRSLRRRGKSIRDVVSFRNDARSQFWSRARRSARGGFTRASLARSRARAFERSSRDAECVTNIRGDGSSSADSMRVVASSTRTHRAARDRIGGRVVSRCVTCATAGASQSCAQRGGGRVIETITRARLTRESFARRVHSRRACVYARSGASSSLMLEWSCIVHRVGCQPKLDCERCRF